MTRRTKGDSSELIFDPEIEKTAKRILAARRHQQREEMGDERDPNQPLNQVEQQANINNQANAGRQDQLNALLPPAAAHNNRNHPQDDEYEDEEDEEETMGTLQIPVLRNNTSCIRLSRAARNYELKHNLLVTLPSFHGLASEDAFTFIKDFVQVVGCFPLKDQITEEEVYLRCFSS